MASQHDARLLCRGATAYIHLARGADRVLKRFAAHACPRSLVEWERRLAFESAIGSRGAWLSDSLCVA